MTIVAAYAKGDTPILFGDLLTSVKAEDQVLGRRLPAVGLADHYRSFDGTHVPFDLKRKIVILAPNCAIAVAGRSRDAIELIRGLRNRVRDGRMPDSALRAHLRGIELYGPHLDASTVGHLVRHDGVVDHCSLGADWFKAPGIPGEVYIAGPEGAKRSFETFLKTPRHAEASSTVNPGMAALVEAMALAALFLKQERFDGKSTRMSIGGGYEVVYFDRGEFRLPPPFTILLSNVRVESGRLVDIDPQMIMRQQYSGEVLLLRSIRLERTGHDQWRALETRMDDQFHYALPIDSELRSVRVPRPALMPLMSEHFVHCCYVHRAEAPGLEFAFTFHSDPAGSMLRIDEQSDGDCTATLSDKYTLILAKAMGVSAPI